MFDLPEVANFFTACTPIQVVLEDQTALLIGHDKPVYTVYEILLLDSGQVVGRQRGRHVHRFNSSLEQYRQSLVLIADALAPGYLDEEENYRALEHALRRVDPMVWDTPGGCYWDGIMEEVSYGFPRRIEPPPGA
jgi:hypothetical protein